MQTPEEQQNGSTILIVDDDPRNVFALKSYLEMLGMHVLTAENGYEAISMVKAERRIGVVLMDMMMPEMDGYETVEKIRKDEDVHVRNIPVIAVTAKAMKGDRERCLEAGANEYVSKPVDLQELLAKMADCLAGGKE